ncbi:hypothetical protein BDZ89DRAFT_1109816 [Hymenopellis radicata]|nr:hypothetical protein BDZ89DRAFT_1109816 [Hymenopellis radicata]
MNISRLLVRQPLRVGNQIRGKPNVRVDARRHCHLLGAPPRSTTLLRASPDWEKISCLLHALGDELSKIPHANPTGERCSIQVLDVIKEDLNAMNEDLSARKWDLTPTKEDRKGTKKARKATNNETRLAHINGLASNDSTIFYPYPFVAGGPLPRSLAEARKLSGKACAAALKALDGAPGLLPLPAKSSAASRKEHLLDFLIRFT